ncbi:MAG: hypothetical protein L6Q97_18400 [Thermoanaerobaculia bacterium]|nr:hypothetical protein [Thermoanaerobaculia bacterium]
MKSGNPPAAEEECAIVTIDMPSTQFDICDFTFTVVIGIFHEFSTARSFTVEFTCPDYFFNYLDNGALQNVSYSHSGDFTTVTGTVVSDPNGAVFPSVHTITLNRNASWAGLLKNFTVKVFDPQCTETLQAEENFNLTTTTFVDLRPFPITSLAQLVADGIIVFPSGPGAANVLPDLLIADELVIDIPAQIEGDGNILRDITLMPGARIRIATNQATGSTTPNLFVKEANIHTCPGTELAEGIVVDPQNTSGAPLTKLQMQNSIVADCRFGINAMPNSSLSLSDNNFTNNYIGLNFDMGSNLGRVRIDALDGNIFSTAGALKEPYPGMPETVESRGFCGIRLNGYRDFNVFGVTTFSSLANGIVAYNSTGSIGNMTFTDMNSADQTPAYPFEGHGIRLAGKGPSYWFNINEFWTNMTFNNCKTGILAQSYALNVENVTMTNLDVGIDVAYSPKRDIIIDGNTITARKFGIRSGLNEPLHYSSVIRNNEVTITTGLTSANGLTGGIEMNEAGLGYTPLPGQTVPQPAATDGWEVDGNTVTMSVGGVGVLYRNGFSGSIDANTVSNLAQPGVYKGISAEGAMFSGLTANTVTQAAASLGTSTAIQSSGGFANTYQCNCVDNTDIGLLFRDLAEFTDAVRGNSFNDHCTGLQIDPGAYIGEQSHRGNLWDLDAVTGSCLGGRNFSSPTLSPFFVNGTANAALNPAVFPSSGWFENEPGTTFDDCAACSFPFPLPPRIMESDLPTKLDEALATDKLYPDLFEDEMNWKGAFRLYRKILRQPAIETYATEFGDFVDAHENLSTGKLAYIAEERAKLFSLSAVEDSLLEDYRLEWRAKIAQLSTMDSLRQAGASVNQGQYEDAVDESEEAQNDYGEYWDDLAQDRQTQIQSLLTLNAAVSVSPSRSNAHWKEATRCTRRGL